MRCVLFRDNVIIKYDLTLINTLYVNGLCILDTLVVPLVLLGLPGNLEMSDPVIIDIVALLSMLLISDGMG